MTKAKTERRKHPRVELRCIIDYLARRDFLICEMKDLSIGGVFAVTRTPLREGEIVHLDFYLPGIRHKIKLKGRVVRRVTEDDAEKDGRIAGMGIEFLDVAANIEEDPIRFISKTLDEDVRG
jgi:Tfp pilus assembly protein PilZ